MGTDLKILETKINELIKEDYTSIEEENKNLNFVSYGYIESFKTILDSYRQVWYKHFITGILAGIWIGIAYTAASFATYHLTNASEIKLIMGAIFPLVLLLIYFLGGGFLTAYMFGSFAIIKKAERWKVFLKACSLVYIGNILGCLFLILLLELSGVFTNDITFTSFLFNNLGMKKMYGVGTEIQGALQNHTNIFNMITSKSVIQSIIWTFFSAIICNILVSLSVTGGKATKGNIVATMVMFWTIIFLFVTSAYQHSVANWHIAAGLLVLGWFHESIIINGQVLQVDLLSGWIFVLINIIPAIIGNYIGAVFIVFLLSILNKEYDELLMKRSKLRLYKFERDNINKNLINKSKII